MSDAGVGCQTSAAKVTSAAAWDNKGLRSIGSEASDRLVATTGHRMPLEETSSCK